jgi:hypothetical protein
MGSYLSRSCRRVHPSPSSGSTFAIDNTVGGTTGVVSTNKVPVSPSRNYQDHYQQFLRPPSHSHQLPIHSPHHRGTDVEAQRRSIRSVYWDNIENSVNARKW